MVHIFRYNLKSQGVKMIEEEPISIEPLPDDFQNEQPEVAEDLTAAPARSNWRIWLAASGCAVLLCAGVFVGALTFAGPKIVQQFIPQHIQTAEASPYVQVHNNTMGDPGAPVHIVEYVDFQCPYCRKFWQETEPQLIEEYVKTGKVYFEYRAYTFLGHESVSAAEAAYCAGDQNKFWEYHDTLFTNWTGENVGDFTKEKLIKYANALKLDTAQFTTCLNGEKHKKTVDLDMVSAKEDGVFATPTFLINGVKMEGAQPFHALKEIIESILNGNIDTQDL
jgi:protein-disulfide isomerase